MLRLLRYVLVLTLLIGVAAAWAALTPEEVEENQSLQTSIVTPHKAWAKGYAEGPVRALVFVNGGHYGGEWDEFGTRLREVIELTQRFDIEADAVTYSTAHGAAWSFHGGKLGEQRVWGLLEKPYDLFVFAGVRIEDLPGKMQYAIMERVVAGAGFIYCGDKPSDYLTQKRLTTPTMLADGIPQIDGEDYVGMTSGYTLGKGRGVWLKYGAFALTPNKPFTWRGLIDYDYRMLLLGRAAVWAAGKASPITITSVLGPEPLTAPRADAVRGEITLSTSGAETSVTADLSIRRPIDGATVELGEVATNVKPGAPTAIAVDLPTLRAGEYYLDAVVKSARGVEAFGAGNFVVESDYGIEEFALQRGFVEAGDPIAGRARLRGEAPAGSILRFRCRDSYDRIVHQQDVNVAAGRAEYPFSFTPDATATSEMRAEALLLARGEEVEMAQATFTVPKRRQGRMNFVQWDTPRDVLGYYQWQKMREAGWETTLIGAMGGSLTAQPSAARAADVSVAPYSTRILDPKNEDGTMKPVCWNDEPAVDEYVQGIVDRQALLREHGVFVYSLGDEGVTKGCCIHPACLAAYREYLKMQYGTIDALNDSWGEQYASFDDVALRDPKDPMESAARADCLPRWYDREAFARYNLMQFTARFRDAYSKLDPLAKTGFEGTGGFGDDFDAICGLSTFYGPYPGIGDDIVRSIYPRERPRSNWMGYSKTGDALADAAWRMVMKNMDGIWWWMWSGIGTYRGYVRPTMDFWPATEDLTREMQPVREGLGDLLLNSEVEHSRIGVYYSLPSAICDAGEDSKGLTRAHSTHSQWVDLTYDLGVDVRYLTSNSLKNGELDTREFSVLLMPMSQAVSEEDAEAIRSFVRAGGNVIADVRPGLYDGHCKAWGQGMLDDVFGIQRTDLGAVTTAPAAIKGQLGEQPIDVTFSGVKLVPGFKPSTAQPIGAVGDTPVLLANRFGEGTAILLNFQMPAAYASDADTEAIYALMRAFYSATGAQAPISVRGPDGAPVRFSETRVWRNGDALVFGIYRKMQCKWFNPQSGTVAGEPVEASLDLPRDYHIYDLRAGKYMGKTNHIDATLQWGRANFYAALPYRLEGLKLALSSSTPEAGNRLKAAVSIGMPRGSRAKHAVWVEVMAPDESTPFWGRQVLLLENGTGEVVLPIAYNDAAGPWRVRATELFSKQTAEATYKIQ